MTALSNEWYGSGAADNLRQILMQMNPHRKEIVGLINILNRMGANFKLIAACLSLQRWKNYYGSDEWMEEDVKGILEGLRS
ncbi:hypothetical protein ACFL2S_03160 [Thermodesulfobacteriota bacterium]|jgi:hypothetical protein